MPRPETRTQPLDPRTAATAAPGGAPTAATAPLGDPGAPAAPPPGGAPAAPAPAGAGQVVLDRYRLRERIGAGGFGVVWRAEDLRLEREVAVKVVHRAGDARAEREARVAARLNHPGIVALYELGADDEAVYLVSELVHGRTLAELGRAGALSDRDVAEVGVAVADALAHAHARGVVHRDVKPANVIVVAEPAAGAGFAKLTDFGVAHLAGGDSLTGTGDVVGTLAYMAPEQAEGATPTAAADVYALALTLYEAWTGENPVHAGSPAATARRLGRPLPPLRSRRRDLPAELGRTLDACLDPDPGFRPPLGDLRDELAAAVERLSEAGGLVEPGTLERVGLGRRRRDRSALGAAGRGLADSPAARGGRLLARVPGRLAAGLAAAGLAAAALALAPGEPPLAPATAAGAVAVAVALLPRLGWLAAALGLLGWTALGSPGLDGLALVAAPAVLAVPLLLPRAGLAWSAPALAPLLGTVGLAPLFAGLAGLAGTPLRRAGLGAAGFAWLAAAEVVTGRALLFGAPDGVPGARAFERSPSAAAADVVPPFLETAALAPAAVWALAAVLLPLAVRGRSLPLDLVLGGLWAAALVAAHAGVADLLSGAAQRGEARGAPAGAVLAVVVAAAAAAVRAGEPAGERPREGWARPSAAPDPF